MRVALRQLVESEIEVGFTHYLKQAGGKVAGDFLDQVTAALSHIAQFPESGSPHYGHFFPDIDLRFWLVRRFPYVIFYVVRDDYVDVIAVLHQYSDIQALLLKRDDDLLLTANFP
jgi:toxin ParE1/3/4